MIAYIVTVVHAATVHTLSKREETQDPEEHLVAWPRWLSALIAGLLVLWLLYQVRGILLPFIAGAIIAYLLNPGIDRLERRGWQRTRAIWVVFGIFLLVFIAGALLVVPALAAEARDLIANYQDYVQKSRLLVEQIGSAAEGWGQVVGLVPADVRDAFGALGERAQRYGLYLLENSVAWLSRSLVLVSLLVITPVVAFWVLRDYHKLGRRLLRALPERHRQSTLGILHDVNRVAGSYLLGMATMVVLVGIFAVIVLTVGKVSFSWLLGIMTGVLYVIPYIGFPAAMVVIALTMGVTGQTLTQIVIVLGVLMAGNVCFDYGVTPRVIGRKVGLHPLLVIFAVLAGATLFKFVGIVIAVPLAGAIKVVLLHFFPEVFGSDDTDAAPA